MYPRIIIDREKFRHNLRYMIDICHKEGISVMGVSKVFCADQSLVNIMIEEDIDYIADSRIKNLSNIETNIPKVLLRLPSIGNSKEVVKYSDISLNSELVTIKELNNHAQELGKTHGVIIMIDLGDLREGIYDEIELFKTIEETLKLPNITIKGIGTNLTCFGGIIPTTETLEKLVRYKELIEENFTIKLEIISGGNSSGLELLLNGEMPDKINNIRLGEAIVLGRETAYGSFLDNMYADVFTLEAEVIEIKTKPSYPIGDIGMNAFGKIPEFHDKGMMKRAILSIGKQDVDHNEIIPFDTIHLLGSSSDHIIVDISEAYSAYEVGDTMLFKLTYSSILSLMTSKYIVKSYE